jgi:hypothetical protein
VPFFKGVGIENLRDALGGGQREMVLALGTHVEVALDLLAEERGLAAVAPHPDAFGHAFGFEVGAPGVG